MKSMYTRLVLIFISVILLSLVITFFIASKYFIKHVETEVQSDLIDVGENFITTYSKPNNQNGVEATLQILSKNFYITLYNESGKIVLKNTVQKKKSIKKDQILKVLNQKNVQKESNPYLIALPFEKDGHKYALFIQPNIDRGFFKMRRVLFFSLLTTLIIGSITFLFVAKLLIKPVKELIRATKELANGNYDVQVKIKRKDEIGLLASNFNLMTNKLNNLEEMRSEFVSNVSHEIQSPLTSIKGFAKVLRNKQLTEEKREHYLTIIETESERLSIMSERLLKLASLDSEQHPFLPTTYKLDEQIRKIILALEPHWESKKLQLVLNLPKTEIVADRLLLEQVWINLLQNGIKFSSIAGYIKVDILEMDQIIKVIISDSGLGISKEDMERIFERFYQADRSRNKKGTGLGLSIVQKIVEMHRGKIEVESDVGKGTSFTIILPKNLET
ncbi:cell wall metabolism sensor histidine kinase WalK [Bacillus sp. AFS017336]|uniref:sensor histidine kinase n=1 Tax=Bacillus sp. AFS017336 TaxID=2033489 RepID=UPI000BF1429D|nr:HAMP domain-containing sensor histidine kinase [Bacillus sp. AFS017336]PEK98549.1 two-component sensor histidine kinase [Bacillus sp. AFS017336]